VGPRWTVPDARIDAVRGCVAVERGPVVLCAESIDLPGGADVAELAVDTATEPLERDGRVYVSARLYDRPDAWPYGPAIGDEEGKPAEIPLIPFHLRATREPASMRVWLPLALRPGAPRIRAHRLVTTSTSGGSGRESHRESKCRLVLHL
jgi:DUF1680 family protein